MQFVHAHIQGHGENIKDQANDPMEEYNDIDNTVEEDEEDGTDRFIYETFNTAGMDDDNNQFDGAYDIHVLQRDSEPVYESSEISILFSIQFSVNTKVVNGLSNTCITQPLRHVIYFVTFST